MKIKFYYIVILFFAIIIAQYVGESYGMLDPSQKIIWYDNVMHTFAGILSGIFIIWAVNKEKRNLTRWQFFWAIVIVAVIMAVLWELFELTIFKMLKDYAISNNYSQSLEEATLDSLSNVLGAGIIGIMNYFSLKKK